MPQKMWQGSCFQLPGDPYTRYYHYIHTAMHLLPFLYAPKSFIHADNHSDWLLACLSDSGVWREIEKHRNVFVVVIPGVEIAR